MLVLSPNLAIWKNLAIWTKIPRVELRSGLTSRLRVTRRPPKPLTPPPSAHAERTPRIPLPRPSPNPVFGVTHFLSLGLIWSRTSIVKIIPSGILNRVGCIDDPQGSAVSQPPNVSWPRNWLYLAPQSRERGNVIQLTERWMLSGRKGWNGDIYTEKGVNTL